MASRKLNVLVYSGNGTTVESVRHCLYTLRRLLGSNYAVIPVTGDMILKEPWTANCAAFVVPGGADMPYCRTLNGEGNRKIRQFVQNGGIYIGFCAGGYYGSGRCEFEVGNKILEVIGERELAFFPGTCRGCAFPGFVYHSEKGARPAEMQVNKEALNSGNIPDIFRTYYNGGGVFVDAKKYRERGVEVLASYTEDLAVDGGDGTAAIVLCRVGDGAALLTGPHPEFATVNLDRSADKPDFDKVVDALANDEKHCMDFVKACLVKVGLKVSDQQHVPSLSRIHLSSVVPQQTSEVLQSLQEAITVEDGEQYIKGANDTFHIVNPSTWKMSSLKDALLGKEQTGQVDGPQDENIIDYNAVVKEVIVHKEDYPQPKHTPYFNHHAFFSNLALYYEKERVAAEDIEFGRNLLYGEVVTSTNTLLEKNPSLLRCLPQGLTFTATVQVAGRGRGSNIWVSPAGSLMFSTVIRHPMSLMTKSPAVFIQYLGAMAVVQGIQTYDGVKYRDFPIKLKWPNDIFALDPTWDGKGDSRKAYTKIGGVLVNSHYDTQNYISVVGIGLNTTNALPTTSLNTLLQSPSPGLKSKSLPAFTPEKLLASILSSFQSLYDHFINFGFDKHLESLYYENWLHMNQIVTLEQEGGARAKIKGITRDYGLLIAEELGWEDRRTGKTWEIMSDGNSFDFFRGLVKRKEM